MVRGQPGRLTRRIRRGAVTYSRWASASPPVPLPVTARRCGWSRRPAVEVMQSGSSAPSALALDDAVRQMLDGGFRHLAVADAQGCRVGVLAAP
ncbi:hypothetical protein ACFQZ4_46540 [Catellatospora coxensis]